MARATRSIERNVAVEREDLKHEELFKGQNHEVIGDCRWVRWGGATVVVPRWGLETRSKRGEQWNGAMEVQSLKRMHAL